MFTSMSVCYISANKEPAHTDEETKMTTDEMLDTLNEKRRLILNNWDDAKAIGDFLTEYEEERFEIRVTSENGTISAIVTLGR